MIHTSFFLDAPSHLYKRLCPSIGPSVGPSVPSYFQTRTILGASCAVYPALFALSFSLCCLFNRDQRDTRYLRSRVLVPHFSVSVFPCFYSSFVPCLRVLGVFVRFALFSHFSFLFRLSNDHWVFLSFFMEPSSFPPGGGTPILPLAPSID